MEKKEGQMLIGSAPAWSRGAPRINREGERVNAVVVTRAGAPVSFFYTEGVATQIWERERERHGRAGSLLFQSGARLVSFMSQLRFLRVSSRRGLLSIHSWTFAREGNCWVWKFGIDDRSAAGGEGKFGLAESVQFHRVLKPWAGSVLMRSLGQKNYFTP
jgi:hypothetical protein